MASSQLISLPNALSVSSLLTTEKGAFQRESCCASALSNESIEAKRLYLIYNGGFHLHQLVGPYASLFLAKGQDSWNRVRTMTYPDGEVVTYAYNAAGQIASVKSNKQGKEETIVEKVGYDKDGHTVYTKLGNGTETTYTYDKRRERLQEMNLTAAGTSIMHNKYQYDVVDNILGITNAVDPTQTNNSNNNKAKLGGAFNHTYAYDDLNRLIKANGKAKSATYEMQMTFGRMSEPLTKVQKVDSTKTAQSYDFTYKYEDSNHPTAPTQIGHEHYTYDANGNPTLVENDSLNTERRMYWDEDNRLMVLSDNGKTSRYTYNAAGERIVKSHGDLEGVYVNGAPQGLTFHETEDYTIYPAPIITVTKNRFTKHYFIGDKRIASKLGTGKFSNVYGISSNNVTAGQKDYAARMMQIEKQREEYYKSLGTPPGVPTMKGATADPDNTGYGYNTIIGELGDHSVPEGWVQRPKFNKKGDVPGPPIQWNKPEDPDNARPGYGFVPADTTNTEEIFFYHSDHLGSTSYITDAKANITQFDAYLPYGELLVDEHSSSEEMPYKFNGKELDQETGLYYYGARYMAPQNSMWLGVDPLTEKYPNLTGYCYTNNNPVKYIDPTGTDWYRNDETAAIFWQEGNANSITYDGQEYRNIGETYSIYQSGMRYDYQQDKIIKVSDASGRFNVEGGQYIPKSFITDDGTKVSVTFKYKSPTGGYGDYALSKDAVSLLIKGINDANISGAGITSIDVSTTTTGKHSPSSNHYASNGGRAIDIDMVNGIPVKNPKSHEKVDAFQRAIRENPILRENFGPNIQEKEGKTKRISGHNNHIHIATQKR